ncbi:hypothetical protein M9H77_37158 [Catharanthus roseus]|uniref:Uncharacterized protein n=1 Tax=Catharanthus roseus TaxID=4058 RepID=A0ACB9ZU67_CATRO|nr:hypothetical protein M9H77_37158 [Catharanthus roseus]
MSSSSSSSSNSKKIVFKSSDGKLFEVDEEVAKHSITIKNLLDGGYEDTDFIPIPNIKSTVLAKVIEYCKIHVEAANALRSFDAEFVKVDQQSLFELVSAADFLYIQGLVDLTGSAITDTINGKTPEEIRERFGIDM